MAECRLVAYTIPENAMYKFAGTGGSLAVVQCETHNWLFEATASVNKSCPIGRIEAATDQAILAIQAEKAKL